MGDLGFVTVSPQVSILIPVFNGERFLSDAISSALSQTYADYEVVVCDNASTDHTRHIAKDFLGDPRLRVVEFDAHVSMPSSFNRALDQAEGDFVRFLCHDDLLEPNCLQRSIAALNESPSAVFATSHETTIGTRIHIREENVLGSPGIRSVTEVARSVVRRGNWIGGPTAVTVRRSAFGASPFDARLLCCFDVQAWLNLLEKGDLYVIPDVLFHSRIHERQATEGCAQGGFRRDWKLVLDGINRKSVCVTRTDILISRAKNALGRM